MKYQERPPLHEGTGMIDGVKGSLVLPPLSVGKMTLRLYAALDYSQNSAHDLRRALNGA